MTEITFFNCLYCKKKFRSGYDCFEYKDGTVCRSCHFEHGDGAGTIHLRGKA